MPDSPPEDASALLVIRDDALRRRLEAALGPMFRNVRAVASRSDVQNELERADADLVVLHAKRGAEVHRDVERLADLEDGPDIVVLTDTTDPEDETRLVAEGVQRVVPLDGAPDHVTETVRNVAAERTEDRRAASVARGAPEPRLADFQSNSARMREFLRLVEQVVEADTTLLVLGETGVGKEHLARAIHREGPRSEEPFVAVNCGALPEALLESELFGHEKGAFTGAHDRRPGRFEAAGRGTIFLDEIGDMPKSLQVRLLSVLQRRELRRVGGTEPLPMEARVIAATNRDLKGDVEAGRFREDLYYRLNVVPLNIPPLRERSEDLPHLIGMLMQRFGERMGREDLKAVNPEALQALLRHDWPGNVREVINVAERAVLLARGDEITLGELPPELGGTGSTGGAHDGGSSPILDDDLAERPLADARKILLQRFERAYLVRLLEATQGVVGETASQAGISPRSLYDKMRRHGLRKEDYRV